MLQGQRFNTSQSSTRPGSGIVGFQVAATLELTQGEAAEGAAARPLRAVVMWLGTGAAPGTCLRSGPLWDLELES